MRVHRGHSNGYALALIAALAMVVAMDASARGVRVASDPNPDPFQGDAWTTTFLGPGDFVTGLNDSFNLGFALNYGQAGFADDADSSQIHIYESGYVSFEPGFVGPPGVDSSGAILQNVAAPFLLKDGVTPGGIDYATGFVDTTAPFDINAAVKAFRATWFVGNDGFKFQIVLLDMTGVDFGNGSFGAAGDFDMEFNYGSDFDDPGAPTPPPPNSFLTAGFALGLNVLDPFAGPFTAFQNYTYSFRSGVLQTTTEPPVGVPEPNSFLLVLTGLAALATGSMLRRRRLESQPAR